MTGAIVRVGRVLVSLLATVALVAVVPFLLVAGVGWPLPTSIPSVDTLNLAARTGISDQFILNTLAVIVWLAWAQFLLALAAEALAAVRGRQATQVRMVLPGFQPIAARLVAGIVMVASAVHPAHAEASTPTISVVVEDPPSRPTSLDPAPTQVIDDPRAGPGASPDATTPATLEHPTVSVQRHDTYWEIAERTLGDGLRWKEIHDLNVGRALPDGITITPGADNLRSGWELLLPVDATVAHSSDTPSDWTSSADQGPSAVVVERGDNLWTIAKRRLEQGLGRAPTDAEIVPYWRDVIDANQDRLVEPGNPDLIYPGQTFILPSVSEGAPSAPQGDPEPPATTGSEFELPVNDPSPVPVDQRSDPPAASTTTTTNPTTTTITPSTTTPSTTVPVESETRPPTGESTAEGSGGSSVPAAVTVGGLSSVALAVGLKRLLARRQRRLINEHPYQAPAPTPPEHRDLHHTIIAQANEQEIKDLQGVLGRLAADLAAAESPRRPRMIRHAGASLEVVLDQPDTNPPPGWTCTDDGTLWTLVDAPDPDDAYNGPLRPSPLMVTMGQPEEDEAQLYLDLEADGLIALVGDPSVARNLARSIITELTLSPLAETLRVIAVGDAVDVDDEVLDHLNVVASWDSVAEDVQTWVTQSHKALAENEWPNAYVARGANPDHDALVPMAVVADHPPPDELLEVLRDALPSAVAVVIIGGFDGAVTAIRCDEDALNFDMIDVACLPQELEADELAAMAQLIVAADSPAEQQLIDQLKAEHEASRNGTGTVSANGPPPAAHEQASVDEPPAFDVLVRLLGDINVEGGKPLKPKGTSVVAYLAMHRSVSTEQLEEACWFGAEGVSHLKRLRDTMTECRSALGSQHFPANRTGSYDAGPLVGTDLDIFDWHVQRAAELDPADAAAHYRTALALVDGKPFSYPNAARASYGWVDLGHFSTTWELRVAQIAQACAEIYLDADQPAEAIAMLRGVVQSIPLNSSVVETLMRAHIANDDHGGAQRVYEEHSAALEQADLGEPEDPVERLRLELQSR